jgi:hypothetical protein
MPKRGCISCFLPPQLVPCSLQNFPNPPFLFDHKH